MSRITELKQTIKTQLEESQDERLLEAVQELLQSGLYIPDEDEMEQLRQSDIDEANGDVYSWEEVKAKLDRRDFSDGD